MQEVQLGAATGHAARWKLLLEPALRGYQVEWVDEAEMLLSRGERLFRTRGPGEPIQPIGSFPAPAWKRVAARARPMQRLLRFLFYNVVKLSDGTLFASFDRSVGVLTGARFEPLEGLRRPCRILRAACALDDEGHVYFGEYLSNPERGELAIYRYSPGDSRVEVVRVLRSGMARHVHGIYRDPYSPALWCVTGDIGDECRVMRTEDGFASLETVGSGDESWRAVSLAFTEAAVYYGTDSEFTRNGIFRLDRDTASRERIGDVDGPVFYSLALGDDLFFTVTAELCPSQIGRSATLWHLGPEQELEPIASFPKDRLHVGLFMMGTLHLPRGPGLADRFYVHGLGLRDADDRTFLVRRSAGD